VSIHAGAAAVDLALPAGVPVGALLPSIVDVMQGHGVEGPGQLQATRYRLSRPGAPTLIASATLAENGIRDGTVLLLSNSATPLPAPRHHDVAEAVSATLDGWATRPSHVTRLVGAIAAGCFTGVGALAMIRNAFRANVGPFTVTVAGVVGLLALVCAAIAHRAYRDAMAGLVLSVIGTAFAGVTGFLAVPGSPGLPHALLAATAALVASVSAVRVSACGVVTLTAIACVAMVIAAAASVGMITAAPLRTLGAASALFCLALLGVAARVSIVLGGLSPQSPPAPDLDARAIRAGNWLTSLLAAFACSAAAAAIVTVLAGAPRLCCIAFGALTGTLLLLRARSEDPRRTLMYATCGIIVMSTIFAVVALGTPGRGAWPAAATAMLVAAAIYLGFVVPALSLSPVVRRGVELLECLALVAMVPMTCWICGVYGAVRGWHLV
jgi:type VII secretion integral membrane protein EccD